MPPRYSRGVARPRTLWTAVFFGTVLATVLTVSHVFMTLRNMARLQELLPAPRDYSWLDDDRPMEVPISYEPQYVAWEDPGDTFSLYNDSEWGTLFPTDGSIRGGATNRTFLVTMVHQLHCLDVIRVGYVTNASHYRGHIEHCLRYLIQSVQCYADTTLEEDKMVFVDGEWQHAVYAWGTEHKCRDRSSLTKYLIDYEGRPTIPQQNLQES